MDPKTGERSYRAKPVLRWLIACAIAAGYDYCSVREWPLDVFLDVVEICGLASSRGDE
jgi:hypothetical protein